MKAPTFFRLSFWKSHLMRACVFNAAHLMRACVFNAAQWGIGENAREDFPFIPAPSLSTEFHLAKLIKVLCCFCRSFHSWPTFGTEVSRRWAVSQKAEKLCAINGGELTRAGRKQIAPSWKSQ